MIGIGAFRALSFDVKKTHIYPYSQLKPTKDGFIFIGPNSLSQVEDLAAVNHVTQAGSKIGS